MIMKDVKASGIKVSSKTRVVCRQAMESHRATEGHGVEAYCLLSRQNSDIANRLRLTREGEFTLQVFWRERLKRSALMTAPVSLMYRNTADPSSLDLVIDKVKSLLLSPPGHFQKKEVTAKPQLARGKGIAIRPRQSGHQGVAPKAAKAIQRPALVAARQSPNEQDQTK
jgi:hypothetical protein